MRVAVVRGDPGRVEFVEQPPQQCRVASGEVVAAAHEARGAGAVERLADQFGHGGFGQRWEGQASGAGAAQQAGEHRVGRGADGVVPAEDDQQRSPGGPPEEEVQPAQRRGIAPLGVVDDEGERAVAHQLADPPVGGVQGLVGVVAGVGGPRVVSEGGEQRVDGAAVAGGGGGSAGRPEDGEVGGESPAEGVEDDGAAGAGGSRDDDEPGQAGADVVGVGGELVELPLAPDDHRTHSGATRGGQAPGRNMPRL